jgi:hypothetical protein
MAATPLSEKHGGTAQGIVMTAHGNSQHGQSPENTSSFKAFLVSLLLLGQAAIRIASANIPLPKPASVCIWSPKRLSFAW